MAANSGKARGRLLVEDFFERALVQVKGEWAGQPLKLLPWQRDKVIRPMFGTLLPNGLRQYRIAYIEIPRKNGKSTLGAGIALYLLLADGEPGAEIYSCAADRFQAAIIFEIAKGMVEANPKLAAMCKVYKRAIVVESTGSAYHVLSADAFTKHGLNPSGIIFDELHAQPNRELWDVMQTGTGARRQPLTVAITTAGYDRHSICFEQHHWARQVLEGAKSDPTFLPVLYGAPEGADWRRRSTWKQANPSLGKTIKLEYLEREAAKAAELPAYQNTFRRLHLNEWTEQETRWIDLAAWDGNEGRFEPVELLGAECFGGLDLSATTDLSAFVLVFPGETDGEPVSVLARFWMPEENMRERIRRDRVPFDVWVREGFVTATPGNVVDYEFIRAEIEDLSSKYRIREIAFDPWNASHLVTQLTEQGANMVEVRQGFASMAGPSKEFERLVMAKQLAHNGNPVLRWMVSNVVAKLDNNGNRKPDKAKSADRIDGVVALIMGIGRMVVRAQDLDSRYEDANEEVYTV